MTVDPCSSCGAAMAADQRYCLACGQRRAEARLNYLEILRGPAAPLAAGGPAAGAADARQRTNVTVIASIGCLLLAMGVGVLIGTAGGAEPAAPAAAPAAQVIKIQGGGTAVADQSAGGTASAKAKAKKKKGDDVETAATAAESKATNPALTQLENTSGDDYSKQSQKLPKVVSTGGKAPPKDDKAPAGGGDFEEIG
jgi:hypothetical protein